jgi:methyltransferase (TIGR00027 family)
LAGAPSQAQPLVRNISDTALWAAIHRAWETERPDALFRDPWARKLAGERGEKIATKFSPGRKDAWSWAMRTYIVDRDITDQVGQGTGMVVNLAAGLDTRPYRMALPATLQWVEVDLAGILDYKEEILANEKPVCRLERVRMDLRDGGARRELFTRLGRQAKRALILSEGLLIYLSPEEVATLARDLAAVPAFSHWVCVVVSPGLKRMLEKRMGGELNRGRAPLKFAPEGGPGFLAACGWKPVAVRSLLKTAAKLNRLTFLLRLLALLPESSGRQGSRPWSGVCLMEKV